ncbi:MAG: succinate dehydrogenase, cytochrome b556 subunit [Pseudomonadota bacterium]|nr:succinate dehydrogenase, cytochrome b556 subunit [Pseudomonadota bacterium]
MSEAVKEVPKKVRPEFRNIHVTELSNYRMPPSAIVSILHRISGAGMFLMLPFLLYLFQLSLRSEYSFMQFKGVLEHIPVKILVLGLSWAYLHHFCAGLRHLFMDNHFALDKDGSRMTAKGVLIVSLLLTVVVGLKLFGVF